MEVVPVYDRTSLIERSIDTLQEKLLEEMAIVALVCVVFLLHLRSALVAVLTLPLAVLMAVIVMYLQGLNANIMSLGGIAIAIGAMVDAAIVMVENAHRHLERDRNRLPHWQIVTRAATEVGPTLFFALLVITISFAPIFTLEAQEGRLFKPLAFTKTYAMAASACSPSPSCRCWSATGFAAASCRRRQSRSRGCSWPCTGRCCDGCWLGAGRSSS